jgi:hypothetical protein
MEISGAKRVKKNQGPALVEWMIDPGIRLERFAFSYISSDRIMNVIIYSR